MPMRGAMRDTQMAEDERPQVDFKVCPKCKGFGAPDRGGKCRTCDGSGELIVERGSIRVIRKAEFHKIMANKQEAD